MQKLIPIFVILILISGCATGATVTETKQEIKQQSCGEAVAELPQIISDAQKSETATVTRIVDGDTVELEDKSKVRLIGINTPEKKEPNYLAAKENLEKLIHNKTVFLEKGVENKDKYGRKLRYIFTKNKFANAEQVSAGLASSFEYGLDKKYSFLFNCLEREAKAKGFGIWKGLGTYNFEIKINQNPDDVSEPNLESIAIKNLGAAINLKDWKLKDEATHIYTFEDFELNNLQSVAIHSGSGTNNATDLFWNLKTTVWNNDHDTAFLRDAEGNLAAEYAY